MITTSKISVNNNLNFSSNYLSQIKYIYKTQEEIDELERRKQDLFYKAPTRRSKGKPTPTVANILLKKLRGLYNKNGWAIITQEKLGLSMFDFGYNKDLGEKQISRTSKTLLKAGCIFYQPTRVKIGNRVKKRTHDYIIFDQGEEDYWYSCMNNLGSTRIKLSTEVVGKSCISPYLTGVSDQKCPVDNHPYDQKCLVTHPKFTKNVRPNINININTKKDINIMRGEDSCTKTDHISFSLPDHDPEPEVEMEEEVDFEPSDKLTEDENKIVWELMKGPSCFVVEQSLLIDEIIKSRDEYIAASIPVNDFELLARSIKRRMSKIEYIPRNRNLNN